MDPEVLEQTILYFTQNPDKKLFGYSQLIENFNQVKNDTVGMHIDKFRAIHNHSLKNLNMYNSGEEPLHKFPKRTLLPNGSYHEAPWTIEFYIQNLMAGKYNELWNIKKGIDPFAYLYSSDSD